MTGFIRSDRVRALLRIVGEGRELVSAGEDPRGHMLQSLTRIVDAEVGLLCDGVMDEAQQVEISDVLSFGWRTQSEADAISGVYIMSGRLVAVDPLTNLVMRTPGALVTRQHCQAAPCPWIREHHDKASVDASILSIARLGDGKFRVAVFKRAKGAGHFDEEAAEVIDLFRSEFEDLLADIPVSRLSPRERDTLELLTEGLPEKLVADRLGVTLHTAHEYVKSVYRKLDVHSRSELLTLARRGFLRSRSA
jgi:DNA-binding CsgD family transcriptional regulator